MAVRTGNVVEMLTEKATAGAIAFIDPRVEDPEFLAAGVRSDVRAIALDKDRPGLEQIDEVLIRHPGIREIHIVSHGEPGRFQLGSDWVDVSLLQQHRQMLARWREFSIADTEILVYGCRVAAGDEGRRFVKTLHHLTGASVAASATPTGRAARSGNWVLETRMGAASALTAFTTATQQGYPGLLTPMPLGSFDTPGTSEEVAVVGTTAYVADGISGVQIIDASDPANPVLLGSYDTPGTARGVEIVGTIAYVADDSFGLQIIDASDPANPFLVGSYDTPGLARKVEIVGTTAYVADDSFGLQIIDASDPANPFLVGSYDTPGNAFDVAIAGTTAYVADLASGLQIIDASDPVNPVLLGSYDTPGNAFGMALVGTTAYVGDATSGLQIIDASDPANPTSLGSYDTPDGALGVAIVGTTAYVADNASGLQIIDASDPANPTSLGSYDTPGGAFGVAIVGTTAYVADNASGLQIIDVILPGITLSSTTVNTNEAGASDSYTLVLNTQPTANVTIDLGIGSQATLSTSSLTFTPANWNVPQTVTVTPVADTIVEGFHSDTIAHTVTSTDASYNGLAVSNVTVNITDDDLGSIDVLPIGDLTATEDGATAAYRVSLPFAPSGTVTLEIAADGETEVSINGNDFARSQTVDLVFGIATDVVVRATDDSFIEADHTGSIVNRIVGSNDPSFPPSLEVPDITVAIADNDVTSLLETPAFPAIGELGSNTVAPNPDRPTTRGTNASEILAGDANDDVFFGFGGDDTISGGDGSDRLYGTRGNNQIFGGNGSDRLFGGSGNDTLQGETGDDVLSGSSGNDLISGGDGSDRATAGNGNDTLVGGEGTDFLNGDGGEDLVLGGASLDIISGGAGSDRLLGEGEGDAIAGNAGADTLEGGDGNDTLNGDDDNDMLVGDAGDDSLSGGNGSDLLLGGAGADFLDGGFGADSLVGGGGSDRYQLTIDATTAVGDTIFGFEDGIDQLVLPAGVDFGQLNLREETTGVSILFENRQLALISNVRGVLIESGDFAIA